MCCFCNISIGKEEWRKEIVNGSRSRNFYGLKGLMPGTAYKVRVGAAGASGSVSAEGVFETGPGEAGFSDRGGGQPGTSVEPGAGGAGPWSRPRPSFCGLCWVRRCSFQFFLAVRIK